MPKVTDNRWMAPMAGKPSLELSWDKPQTISRVQQTLDSGMTRGELTLTSADSHAKKMILAPQPELLRDYKIEGQLADSGKWETLAEAKDNLHRLVRHEFASKTVKAIRLTALATNGDELARVYEVRCYA